MSAFFEEKKGIFSVLSVFPKIGVILGQKSAKGGFLLYMMGYHLFTGVGGGYIINIPF